MANLAFDVIALEREIALLVSEFPELADDETLRADTIEGETDAHTVLGRITRRALDAKAMCAAIKERQQDLAARRSRYERQEEAMRALIFRLMKAGDLPKVTLPEATLSRTKKAGGVVITDEAKLLPRYTRTTVVPDRAKIAEALKAGRSVKGAELAPDSETLTIRAQ